MRRPVLDFSFVSFGTLIEQFESGGDKNFAIAIERNDGLCEICETKIFSDEKATDKNLKYAERLVKFMLWAFGGYKVTVCGDKKIFEHIAEQYSLSGQRKFDVETMEKIYCESFSVEYSEYQNKPKIKRSPKSVGRSSQGCRIGFDAGGSDRKVSAVIDGEAVFSEEVVWNPKTNSDPDYHYQGILSAFKQAASKMPRVDAIGVSSAGVYVNNKTRIASLFLKVPKEDFEKSITDIYIRAAKEIGDVPLTVANDGDVTALAGAMSLSQNCVLGIAMGTSEAGGFVDSDGNITGWLNELAFTPVDVSDELPQDEWSGDFGVGCKYFSQDAVIRLAEKQSIPMDKDLTPAQKLKTVQELLEKNDPKAIDIYSTIGTYLGHALAAYYKFYGMEHVLLLGRVMSGKGGEIIKCEAELTLSEDYRAISKDITLYLPDEKVRRVGQSVAAASL